MTAPPRDALHTIRLGVVNAFVIDTGDALILVDTGVADSADAIVDGIRDAGLDPARLRQIVLTHAHADHSGSAAELKRRTGAAVLAHPADAALLREGRAARHFHPAPGLLNRVLYWLFIRPAPKTVEPVAVDRDLHDGELLDLHGVRLRVLHVPGHSAGQVALLWEERGVLFAADAASNVLGRLGPSIAYEDFDRGVDDLRRLASAEFEVACFGHGRAITAGASRRFRRRWPQE